MTNAITHANMGAMNKKIVPFNLPLMHLKLLSVLLEVYLIEPVSQHLVLHLESLLVELDKVLLILLALL